MHFQGLIPQSLQIQADRASSSKSCASKPNLGAEDGRHSGLEFGCWRLIFCVHSLPTFLQHVFAIIFGCLENRSCRELLWSIFLGLPSWPCLRAHNLSHLLKVYLRRQAFEDLAPGEKVAWQGADSPAFVGSCGSGRLGSEPIILSSLAPKVLTFQGWNTRV